MENPPPFVIQDQGRTVTDVLGDLLGAAVLVLTPKDRPRPEDPGSVTPKEIGLTKAKDVLKGAAGFTKSVTIDQALLIFGAQPLSSGDQTETPAQQLLNAARAVVTRERGERLRLADVGLLREAERDAVLDRIRSDERLRQQIASTAEGQQFLGAFGIRLTATDQVAAAALADVRAVVRRDGLGRGGLRAPDQLAADQVVNALTFLERLFAANPPDP